MRVPSCVPAPLESGLSWLEPVDEDLAPGARLGPFEVLELLGRGGMGTVYRARDLEQGGLVALKLLHARFLRDPQHLRRFRQEAVLAAQLEHPGIVRVLGYGEADGRAWLSMQLVEGPNLEQVVEREGPLPPERAVRLLLEAARALEAAHQGGVLHRDLKPSNLVLLPGDRSIVLDFGLAKDMARSGGLTASGDILGTPAFVAPEVVAGGPIDRRVDVYGLGTVLYFALSGRRLHEGDTPIRVLQSVLRHRPPRLREVAPALPADLDAICAQALARDPADRYPDATALAADLERWLAGRAVAARPPGRLRLAARSLRRHPWIAGLLLAGLLAAALTPLFLRRAAERLARHQRAAQAEEHLQHARLHAREGRPARAEEEYLQAMLLVKGAFLEDPDDEALRDGLVRAKRERAEHAERQGHWELALELRRNLARLEGEPQDLILPPAGSTGPARLRVRGLGPGEAVRAVAWTGGALVATQSRDLSGDGELSLEPGAWVVVHRQAGGPPRGRYLVVLGPGQAHELALGAELPPPVGVWRLPDPAEVGALD